MIQELVTTVSGLMAEHLGFNHRQVYLFNAEANVLRPQIENGDNSLLDLAIDDNPFATAFKSGHGQVLNATAASNDDGFFRHDMALVLPLVSQGEHLGVAAWWERRGNKPQFALSDKELGTTVATTLAQAVHIRKLKG